MAVILDGASGATHNLESDPMSVFLSIYAKYV
jgi:hypothetical protein